MGWFSGGYSCKCLTVNNTFMDMIHNGPLRGVTRLYLYLCINQDPFENIRHVCPPTLLMTSYCLAVCIIQGVGKNTTVSN